MRRTGNNIDRNQRCGALTGSVESYVTVILSKPPPADATLAPETRPVLVSDEPNLDQPLPRKGVGHDVGAKAHAGTPEHDQ